MGLKLQGVTRVAHGVDQGNAGVTANDATVTALTCGNDEPVTAVTDLVTITNR